MKFVNAGMQKWGACMPGKTTTVKTIETAQEIRNKAGRNVAVVKGRQGELRMSGRRQDMRIMQFDGLHGIFVSLTPRLEKICPVGRLFFFQLAMRIASLVRL